LYSSLYPAHFEKHSSKGLAAALSVFMILITSFTTMTGLSNGFALFGEFPVVILEERISENVSNFEELAKFGIISNIGLLFVFAGDIYLNFIRKLPVENSSLSVAYQ
ncbi:hypothetical protein PMAYCL1PPCAC_15144, partial [Pristionchus mayeri]